MPLAVAFNRSGRTFRPAPEVVYPAADVQNVGGITEEDDDETLISEWLDHIEAIENCATPVSYLRKKNSADDNSG